MVEKVPLRVAFSKLKTPVIIAFGNPLLDVYVFLKNKEFLKKHNLTEDGEMELSDDKMQELLADLPLELVNIFVIVMCLHCTYFMRI